MNNIDNDNRTLEEIRKGWEKNGLVFGKVTTGQQKKDYQQTVSKERERAKRKSNKAFEKELRSSREKPSALVSIAGVLEKFMHTIITLFTMAIVINIFFGWQIYKLVSVGGWQSIFQTKYTLFILLYFVLLFVLKKVYLSLYKYANE